MNVDHHYDMNVTKYQVDNPNIRFPDCINYFGEPRILVTSVMRNKKIQWIGEQPHISAAK